MPFVTRHWLLHWVPSYNADAVADRRFAAPKNLPAGLDKITEITPEYLEAFLKNERPLCRLDELPGWASGIAYMHIKMPQLRGPEVARYVAAIQRGEA